MKGNFAIFGITVAFFAANQGFAADSTLDAPPSTPCTQGADYVPGIDVAGQPVPRADIGAEHTAIPDQVYVPLPNRGGRGRGGPQPGDSGPYAAIDGKRLDNLINPAPCAAPPVAPARRR